MRIPSARLATVLLAVLGCTLSGCGFHLQGTGSLPPALARTYLDSDEQRSEFVDSLADVLRLHGADIVALDEANAVLEILGDETGQRVLSVSARNIPREFEIYYAVTFSLSIDGEQRIEPESLVVTRAYTYDETEVLAKAREEQILRRALAEDLARQVVRRIEALRSGAAAQPPAAAASRPPARIQAQSPAPASGARFSVGAPAVVQRN